MANLDTLRRRRGVAKRSITNLHKRVDELERDPSNPDVSNSAKRILEKLESHDNKFKEKHLAIIDLTNDEKKLDDEQNTLDSHDDVVAALDSRLHKLIISGGASGNTNARKVSSKRLARLESILTNISSRLKSIPSGPESVIMLQQFSEQLTDSGRELCEVRSVIFSLDLADSDILIRTQKSIEDQLFDLSLNVKKYLATCSTSTSSTPGTASDPTGVKLPKIDVPTFDGHILQWRKFWEQFELAVHKKSSLSQAEKLIYLQHALKGGSAKHTIEGLSSTGDHYDEAIECLKARYNRPRLIHQAHVRMITESPPIKDGTGRELRKLHDNVQQHVRALRSLGYDSPSTFLTSIIELKLDQTTMFEWRRHSESSVDVPPYEELLKFLDMRAQATESIVQGPVKQQSGKPGERSTPSKSPSSKPISPFPAIINPMICVACKNGTHPLYACTEFKNLDCNDRTSIVKSNNLCLNCLHPGHRARDCRSSHRCKQCQRPHHTLLHNEPQKSEPPKNELPKNEPKRDASGRIISAHAAVKPNVLLMTCQVLVQSPEGTLHKARALLDSGSSTSFVSERIAQALRLPRTNQSMLITGIACLSSKISSQATTQFYVRSVHDTSKLFHVDAMIVPKVTCDLPLYCVSSHSSWDHITGLKLADPEFGVTGRIDLLLGIDTFIEAICNGRRVGDQDMPVAFETHFGWVLAGNAGPRSAPTHVAAHHASVLTGDQLIQQFWETEEAPSSEPMLTVEDKMVIEHFQTHHSHLPDGRFVVPLPRKRNAPPLGESRTQAVRRFHSFEHSLHAKNQFHEVKEVMDEYFKSGHAEEVPVSDHDKPPSEVFYLPIHCVRKESSTTTKVRAVFDASAKTSTGISLNETLLVGPTVHSTLVEVLLRFRLHRVALTADVSRMYRAIALTDADKDLHRFVWRNSPQDTLRDFRMTRVTFGVAASSFIANMCVKQNALNYAPQYPLAMKAVMEAFYVDDGVTGADTIEEAVTLQRELHCLFAKAGFLLRKWNSSELEVLDQIDPELKDSQCLRQISEPEVSYTKTLGVEWNAPLDHFRLITTDPTLSQRLTKRQLVSDIAKIYDVLGWYSPVIITAKILLQRVWEERLQWDDPVPPSILTVWLQWRNELPILSSHRIPRYYFNKDAAIVSVQLHGFSDASQAAYAGVVYLRAVDSQDTITTSLVISKTKVAPLKKTTIPRLELCGALVLAQLLHHCKKTLNIRLNRIYAWTDSTIVLNWLSGNTRRFKTYVGNRVTHITELIAPDQWRHVSGIENPADCASRGLFPSELVQHHLWWHGPDWLKNDSTTWPKQQKLAPNSTMEEGKEICAVVTTHQIDPLIPHDQYSSHSQLIRVTAWMIRFTVNCRTSVLDDRRTGSLTISELRYAEVYWVTLIQREQFTREIDALTAGRKIPRSSSLISLNPFLDDRGLLRVGGREHHSSRLYDIQHPLILHAKHSFTKRLIVSEHKRLLHAGPTLLSASLYRRFHLVRGRNAIRSVTRACVTCRRNFPRLQSQLMGQLPAKRITPDIVFNNVGVDYAGPIYIKRGATRRPCIVKAYVAVFVSLTVKAVHIEAVSDLTAEAFIACLRRFVARRGKPESIWSDHGTNFIGANNILKDLYTFLRQPSTEESVTNFCSSQGIQWEFIPEKAPHFGGLWEAAVKSFKRHLSHVTANVKLNFEELSTTLSQIEACLNSRPLMVSTEDIDGIQALTPGHFLIGRPIEALPDSSYISDTQPTSILKRWHLCQTLVRHFWKRWSSEYLTTLQRIRKWRYPKHNIAIGDIVVMKEDNLSPTTWPLAKVIQVHPGEDGHVRVVTVQAKSSIYKRPIHKIALLLSHEN